MMGLFAMSNSLQNNVKKTPQGQSSGRSSMIRLEDTLKKKDLGELIEYSMSLMEKPQPKFASPKKVSF